MDTHPKEPRLEKLGIFPVEIPLPFSQVSSVNAFLIKGDSTILIDAGLGTEEGWTAVGKRLSSLGLSPRDIGHIYLTHGHLDHYGLAQAFVENSGGRVHIHKRDEMKVTADLTAVFKSLSVPYREYFSYMGVPEPIISGMTLLFQASLHLAKQVSHVEHVAEGERLLLKDREVVAMEFPGHSPGMVCYYDTTNRILFSGDHLLPKISPNPVIDFDQDGLSSPHARMTGKFKGLVEYLRSLEKAEALDIDLVLPGHGQTIHDHRELIGRLRKFYRRRQEKILKVLKKGPMTAYDITLTLFPTLKDFDIFLAVSEIIGNLEVLEEEGAVRAEKTDGHPGAHPPSTDGSGVIRYRIA